MYKSYKTHIHITPFKKDNYNNVILILSILMTHTYPLHSLSERFYMVHFCIVTHCQYAWLAKKHWQLTHLILNHLFCEGFACFCHFFVLVRIQKREEEISVTLWLATREHGSRLMRIILDSRNPDYLYMVNGRSRSASVCVLRLKAQR